MLQVDMNVDDATTGAPRSFFHDVFNLQAHLRAITAVFFKDVSLKRRRHHDVLAACGLNARQKMLQERMIRRRQHRLWSANGQRAQPRAASPDEDHRVYCPFGSSAWVVIAWCAGKAIRHGGNLSVFEIDCE